MEGPEKEALKTENVITVPKSKLDVSGTGKYAYASICSLALNKLFPEKWNQEFNHELVNSLSQHLGIGDKMKSVMTLLMEGNSVHSEEPYISLLNEEANLKGKPILVIQDLVLFAINKGEYDARLRVLVRYMSNLLQVPYELVELYEYSLLELLSKRVQTQSKTEEVEVKRREKMRKIKRYATVGIATVAGGTLIGLTGGLAAPLLGAGIGVIFGGASAAAIGTTAGAAILGSIFGVAGAGLTGYKMKKRVGEIEEFCFIPVRKYDHGEHLHIAIVVTGWLTDEEPENVVRPWQSLDVSREQYALRYETKYLYELGQALEYILTMAVSFATQEALKYTILSGLMTAVAWPTALLSMSSVIDNPWSVCCRRSSEVGKHLAHILKAQQHGKRPVTLIGFSLGARVIFYCLREMAELGNSQGIIQDAIMLGTPVTNSSSQWEKCSTVVAGKIINGYCSSDWLLKFLYRTLSMTTGVAGLMPVNCPRVSNVDLSELVSGHTEYCNNLTDILKFIGVRTKDNLTSDAEGSLKKSTSDCASTTNTNNNVECKMKISKSDVCLPQQNN